MTKPKVTYSDIFQVTSRLYDLVGLHDTKAILDVYGYSPANEYGLPEDEWESFHEAVCDFLEREDRRNAEVSRAVQHLASLPKADPNAAMIARDGAPKPIPTPIPESPKTTAHPAVAGLTFLGQVDHRLGLGR